MTDRSEAIALAQRVIEQVDGGRMDMFDANILARALLKEDDHHSYLIWSNEHRAWWGPSFLGYEKKLTEAGGYTRNEALKICADALPGAMEQMGVLSELPVRRADVLEFITGRFVPESIR